MGPVCGLLYGRCGQCIVYIDLFCLPNKVWIRVHLVAQQANRYIVAFHIAILYDIVYLLIRRWQSSDRRVAGALVYTAVTWWRPVADWPLSRRPVTDLVVITLWVPCELFIRGRVRLFMRDMTDIVRSLGVMIIAGSPIPRSISRYCVIDMNPSVNVLALL